MTTDRVASLGPAQDMKKGATTYISAHDFAHESPCFLILPDDATALFMSFSTHSRRSMQWSMSAAITAVRLGACVSRSVSNKRWRAMEVELKLHLQMGRSSSNPLMVVATSGSVARMKFESQPGLISKHNRTIEAMPAPPHAPDNLGA